MTIRSAPVAAVGLLAAAALTMGLGSLLPSPAAAQARGERERGTDASADGPLPAAAAPDATGAVLSSRAALAARIAVAWEVSAASVRVDLPPDAPEVVDSLHVTEGSADRWIVTFWAAGRVTRRFVRAGMERRVPVAARALSRGHVLEPEDVAWATRVAWGRDADVGAEPVGWVVQRRIGSDEVLEPPAVRPPLVVRGGDAVDAVLHRSGVSLTVRAEALASAREGEAVAVRMPSGIRMEGRALGSGVVILDEGGSR